MSWTPYQGFQIAKTVWWKEQSHSEREIFSLKGKKREQIKTPLWMKTLCSYSLIIVSVYAELFEVHESYSNQLRHPGCFPVWTIFLKVGCLSAWKYYPFSKYFHPKPAAVLSKWLSEFRWVSVYETPIHKTDWLSMRMPLFIRFEWMS